MAHVLLSFARSDADLAERVGRWLSAERHTVLFQSDLDASGPGVSDADTGVEAVHQADLLFCIVSPRFAASSRCMAVAGMAAWAGVGVFVLRTGAGEAPLPPWPLTGTIDPDGEVVDELAGDSDDPDGREALREQIVAGIRRWDVSGRWTRDDPPYPGLRPFDTGMAQVFFGRDEDSRRLIERLRAPAGPAGAGLTLVVGPSGSGKSSLVRAGVMPLLQADPAWLVCPPLTPGVDPGTALGQVLTHVARTRDGAWTRDGIERALNEPDGLARLAKQLLAGGTEQRMLLVLDQIEELFTRTSPSAREKFLALLAAAASGPVQAVATLRSEFLDDMLTAAGEAELPVGTFTLTALRPEALRAVVTGPARLAGVRVDEPLVDRLVADAGSGQALPLLAFVLEQLARGVRDGGELSEERYEELGGVSGALAAQADAALAAAQTRTGRSRADVLAGLLRLVTVDDAGNTTRRSVGLDSLPEAVRIELGEFVDRRLLTTDDSADGPVVAVAHERVLTAWPPLAEAIGRENDVLRLRRTAEAAAAEWERRGRPADHLWPLGRATAARETLKATDLISNVRAFLATSTSQGRRRRQQYIALLAVLSVTVIGVAFALVQAQVASRERDRAEAARRQAVAGQLLARAYGARNSDPGAAFRLAAVAETVLPGSGPEAALMDLLVNSGVDASLSGHSGPVWSVAFSPDGHTLATGSADQTVLLWDLTDRTTPRRLGAPLTSRNGPVESMAFAPDGHTLATGNSDGAVVLWDVSDRAAPRRLGDPLTGGEDSVGSLAFSPDGKTLATGRDNRTVVLWDVSNRAAPRRLGDPLTGYNDSVASVAFSPDGRTLATGSDDRTVVLWDVSNPAAPRRLGDPLTSHHSSVWSVVFSPDGRTLATGSDDQTVLLWDVSDPAAPRRLGSPLASRNGPVLSVAFSPDGNTLATSSSDGTVALWDVSNRAAPRQFGGSLTGHNDPVRSVAFSPDGHTLATGSDDQTVVLWDVSNPAAPRQLGDPLTSHKDPVRSVAFSPDGHTLATGSDDRT
ncbi:AAA family ATPase, partial [Frankia sp. Cr2]|uniref:nSTAND1 domain-containing NTPase n=1 Tax=Frankia sp. Cr2 TaxID=3073932 RepID=UPI002AD3E8CB